MKRKAGLWLVTAALWFLTAIYLMFDGDWLAMYYCAGNIFLCLVCWGSRCEIEELKNVIKELKRA